MSFCTFYTLLSQPSLLLSHVDWSRLFAPQRQMTMSSDEHHMIFLLTIILVRFLERIIYTHFFHFLMCYSLTFFVWLLSPLIILSSQIQWEPWPSIPHPLNHWTLSLSPHWKPFLPWLIRSISASVQFNSS